MSEEIEYIVPQRRARLSGDLGKLNEYERALPNLREQLIAPLMEASQLQYAATFSRCLETGRAFAIKQRGGSAAMDVTVTSRGFFRKSYDFTMRASIELPTMEVTVDMA